MDYGIPAEIRRAECEARKAVRALKDKSLSGVVREAVVCDILKGGV